MISRADVASHGADAGYELALSEVLQREAPFLRAGSGGPSDDWSWQVTPDIVRYWNVYTPDEYCRFRAGEFVGNPHLGWAHTPDDVSTREESHVDLADGTPEPQPSDDERDAFISHPGEDSDIARQLADLLMRDGWRVWLDKLEMTVGDSLSGTGSACVRGAARRGRRTPQPGRT